jgi:hypothetical protein
MTESSRSTTLAWRKSARSGVNGGACVEVAFDGRSVLIRDSKNRTSSSLIMSVDAWHSFLRWIKETNV